MKKVLFSVGNQTLDRAAHSLITTLLIIMITLLIIMITLLIIMITLLIIMIS